MKEKRKVNYQPPQVWITRVALESGIAVDISIALYDWEDGGTIGDDGTGTNPQGGDIILF